jgi:hypothetical protein
MSETKAECPHCAELRERCERLDRELSDANERIKKFQHNSDDATAYAMEELAKAQKELAALKSAPLPGDCSQQPPAGGTDGPFSRIEQNIAWQKNNSAEQSDDTPYTGVGSEDIDDEAEQADAGDASESPVCSDAESKDTPAPAAPRWPHPDPEAVWTGGDENFDYWARIKDGELSACVTENNPVINEALRRAVAWRDSQQPLADIVDIAEQLIFDSILAADFPKRFELTRAQRWVGEQCDLPEPHPHDIASWDTIKQIQQLAAEVSELRRK